jgi:hypothetical protein
MALNYLSGRQIAIEPDSHVVLAIVRNELLRLPYLLSYYRRIGFDRFIFVDNGSTDGTRELLLESPDTFLFTTQDSFGESGGGAGLGWKNALLDEYCVARWVLVADADELLVWPGSEQDNIKRLTRTFDAVGAEALLTVMIDMYSDKPFGKIGYVPGAPFIESCPFFDHYRYYRIRTSHFPFRQFYGGVRERVFQALKDPSLDHMRWQTPTMSKVPLVRWRKGQRFVKSTHALFTPMKLAPMRGALLHFKMFDDLPGKCEVEAAREQHFDKSREYKVLGAAIKEANGCFYDPAHSMRYEGTRQLESLGFLNSETAL